ncbi:dodecin domain-containing protein [Salinisphaera sp. USBA-960]|uniref:dodecin n=1 Tax=Salinisphaera orenii TaxID=856731 RepID=UPI000DBE58F6|nr:dodecin domain-containing protein [Salifodinibacter halophilus]NNC27157.1 dodecin domain-containing protein [Salifodinibacter halophilus]
MSDNVYKTVELTGSSETSQEDAVRKAIHEASRSIANLRWFEVTDVRGHIVDNEIGHWQVSVKVGFTIDNQ